MLVFVYEGIFNGARIDQLKLRDPQGNELISLNTTLPLASGTSQAEPHISQELGAQQQHAI